MMNQPPNDKIHWLPETEYDKAVSQLRLQIGGVLSPLRKYGQDPYVDEAISVIVKLAEDFGLRVRGVDQPIDFNTVATRNGYRKND
jgi:hypothetical protein